MPVAALKDVDKLKKGEAGTAVLSLEGGFETSGLVVIGEQDILGDRMVRRSKRRKRAADFISEAAGLDEGSVVVHAEHGIGRLKQAAFMQHKQPVALELMARIKQAVDPANTFNPGRMLPLDLLLSHPSH